LFGLLLWAGGINGKEDKEEEDKEEEDKEEDKEDEDDDDSCRPTVGSGRERAE
jgi:hypothetical protein